FEYIINNIINEKYRNEIKQSFKKLNKDIELTFSITRPEDKKELFLKIISKSVLHNIKLNGKIIGIIQDITQEKQNEELLRQARDKAEESDTLKSAFLANMSHEIRTPLNAILGFSKLLTLPDIGDEKRQQYSEYISSSANNLLNLIKDIIDVSKIEAGKVEIENRVAYINKILDELKVIFDNEKLSLEKNDIEISIEKAIEDADFQIITDPNRLKQILINLIGNALKFINRGYIKIGYEIKNDKFLQFFVKDTGIGIPENKMELIFSRFGQIIDKKIKNPGGTGLGLSITKHLIDRLGGEIWVKSKLNFGTTFLFTIPYKKSTAKKNVSKPIKIDSKKFENLKILAVEDDIINMHLLEDSLKMFSDKIVLDKAKNGFEAIQLAEKNNYDLIIMDVRMPVMDGYEATEHIRNKFPFPKNKVPILGLSAHVIKTEVEKGKKIGMTDFLSKPIELNVLLSKIAQITNSNINLPSDNEQFKKLSETEKQIIIDISFFQNMYKGDIEKINKTLQTYLLQIPQQLNELDVKNKNNELENVKFISHSLKSTLKYLGRLDLSNISKDIEILADKKNTKRQINSKILILKKNWLEIEKELNSFING
ncbi:MAG: response regulator, partial [Bacteroidales bacterium]|nr:response regulator [Bacteroidales bacterium]